MRPSGFTRIGALVGFFGSIAIIVISAFQFDSEEVSRGEVILAEVLFGVPIFTVVGAAVGAGWDFFERRTSREGDAAPEVQREPGRPGGDVGAAPEPQPRRRRRRNPPGGRRRR